MPKIRTLKSKRYPAGWDLIEPTLTELTNQMRDFENEPPEGKRKCEALWDIWRLHHQRSRYIYELFYKKKEMKLICRRDYFKRGIFYEENESPSFL